MTSRPLYVGIDLGTTNSTAAVFDGEQVTLVRNAQGSPLTPSVVRVDGKGSITVGSRARRYLETDPANTRSEFKRLMGTDQVLEFPASKLARRPVELAAEILKALREDVRQQVGVLPERAVVSVPALFEVPQSSATAEAATLAGFERVELIQEPVASALAAGWSRDDPPGAWLVYDLGGGTFDVSLLETRDGMLRVVAHDGDNFLGGRDMDWRVVEWALAEVKRQHGVDIRREDPSHAPALRKLKSAAEDAKIELTRAPQADLNLPGWTTAEGKEIDVDLQLSRTVLDALCTPLVDRSIEVCKRLLDANHVKPGTLARVVLVGGPTAMPLVRQRLKEALGAPVAEGLDPMTLVAQGAALYAASAGLDARPREAADAKARQLWLRYPALSSDLSPYVVGRVLEEPPGPALAAVRLVRADGQWKSADIPVGEDGSFLAAVELVARQANVFALEAAGKDGQAVPVSPGSITLVNGLTIADPPLSRSIGVALANDGVWVYFERGCPLPARKTVTHRTVEGVAKGVAECMLKIPIVQGEFSQAHLCRLVGSIEIPGSSVASSLPSGSPVELTLELDRGGRLSARALVPALQQVFEGVAHLVTPTEDASALLAGAASLRERVTQLRQQAFQRGTSHVVVKLNGVEGELQSAERDAAAARGGDADAGQKARRTLLDVDARLDELEMEGKWPELEDRARRRVAWAASWVARYGTEPERKLLNEVVEVLDQARREKRALELDRQMKLLLDLGNASFYRDPEAWETLFDDAASEMDQATDLPRAQQLVKQGQKARERGDRDALRDVVKELWRLLPPDAADRRLGYDSGVR